ncbi:CD74 molecule, major histocompatibility complex, class II invariant chain b [Mugil cephalus]|uniref:CD74 molecule, major histocompatibility complex, class II invariant chain b n=1 Tax=Mugil cephalus TaxID=48193 RepID=UPI001FB683DC|nr:CD74 molecule, major histocompatibility complex, class II invariant chain b [Mugil cephalus]
MSDSETPNQPLLNHQTAVNVEAQPQGGQSSSRAYKVAGLVLLASVLIVGQVLTAYFVFSQGNDIKALEKQNVELQSDMTKGRSVAVHVPMNVLPGLMDNTMDVMSSTGEPESDTPLTACQQEAAGKKPLQVPGFRPDCDSNGLYRPQQCFEQYCWCVNPVTGDQILGSQRQGPVSCVRAAMPGRMNMLTLDTSDN